jgi:putative heme iron utilization protein
MNKIVREHYPVSNLPEDLRVGFSGEATVRVVIEEQPAAVRELTAPRRMNEQEFNQALALLQRGDGEAMTLDRATAEIRALRNEWDGE